MDKARNMSKNANRTFFTEQTRTSNGSRTIQSKIHRTVLHCTVLFCFILFFHFFFYQYLIISSLLQHLFYC